LWRLREETKKRIEEEYTEEKYLVILTSSRKTGKKNNLNSMYWLLL
jgi:hypothetical protein